ncbi:MAG: hypothetical protein Q4G59_10490, partial [Planctomycetia bacterium]|nr:hypothetical protein [Planctomycetia bacterium]
NEAKRSIVSRLGTDREIQTIAAQQKTKSLRLIETFSWSSFGSRKSFFQSKYAAYTQCITAVISLSVNQDQRAIPYLKRAIMQYSGAHEASSKRYIYDLFVWCLLCIDGKHSYDWFVNEMNEESQTGNNADTKYYFTFIRTFLWLYDNNDCHLDVPDFISNMHINRFDEEWPIRFYFFYCDFYNIRGFDSPEEWAKHIILNDEHFILKIHEEGIEDTTNIFGEIFTNSCQIMYNELTKSDHYKKTFHPLLLHRCIPCCSVNNQ